MIMLCEKTRSVAVLFVHGPGGIGKTALLGQFADLAVRAGARVVRIDARDLHLSPAGVEAGLRQAVGFTQASPFAVLAKGPRPVLSIDTYEALVPLDDWVRERLLPRLPTSALTIIAGRQRPALGWADPAWRAVTQVLTLTGIPDQLHRRTLEACAITRSTTEESLRAALGVQDASRLFGWLRGLSFVAEGPFGLFPHDLVRDLLEEDLRWRDPSAYRMLRSRVREHIVYRIRNGHGLERERATRDLFLLQRSSPQFAAHFTWGDPGVGWEDCVRPDDARHLIGLVAQAEGVTSAAIAQFWLRRQPEAFRVYRRGRSDHPVAMMAWLKLDNPDRHETDADPLVASAWDYVQRVRPLRPGEHLGIARFLVDPACYQRPSQLMTTMQVRVAGAYISADRIAWSVYAYANAALWTSLMTYIDHPLLDGANCTIGPHTYTLFGHDWRVTPLHEWLDLLAERGIQRQSVDGEPLREPQRHRLLSQDQFAEAVRRALRDLHDRRQLASNPLLETCLVRDSVERPVERLVSLLEEAIDQLRLERGGDKLHRAVHRTYVHPAPSHERAAEILGLPFSTYRRHLARGVGSVTGWLWAREASGEHD